MSLVERLAAIAARADAATPGPWVRMTDGCGCVVTDEWTVAQHGDNPRWSQTERDGDFIAAARQDVPWLLDRLASREAFAQAVLALCDAYHADDHGHPVVTVNDVYRLADEHLGRDHA